MVTPQQLAVIIACELGAGGTGSVIIQEDNGNVPMQHRTPYCLEDGAFLVCTEVYRNCLSVLEGALNLVVEEMSEKEGQSSAAVRVSNRVERLSASEFIRSSVENGHVDIWEFDVDPSLFGECENLRNVRSLRLSKLRLNDSDLDRIFEPQNFSQLSWLDLSGNPGISYAGVHDLAQRIAKMEIPKLGWLELLGTGCDATPYVDGAVWRMTTHARRIQAKFGDQRWMMLGTKNIDDENREILSVADRQLPPNRFKFGGL